VRDRLETFHRRGKKDGRGKEVSAPSFTEATAPISASREAGAAAAIRILVVASVRLFREGLAQILDRREGLTIVGMARDSMEALGRIQELTPQIVLLDMADAESHAIAREIGNLAQKIRIVALGVTEVEGDVLACAEAGIAEYVPREGSLDDLTAAIKSAALGEVHCTPQQAGSLWRRLAALAASQQQEVTVDLTRREREIVRLIDHELSNKEIARQLGIEVATVKNHVHNLLDKLHVTTRTQAASRMRGGMPSRSPRPTAT
jgi:two-component system, NarL family, nitrate/nitrite response regulator NarL